MESARRPLLTGLELEMSDDKEFPGGGGGGMKLHKDDTSRSRSSSSIDDDINDDDDDDDDDDDADDKPEERCAMNDLRQDWMEKRKMGICQRMFPSADVANGRAGSAFMVGGNLHSGQFLVLNYRLVSIILWCGIWMMVSPGFFPRSLSWMPMVLAMGPFMFVAVLAALRHCMCGQPDDPAYLGMWLNRLLLYACNTPALVACNRRYAFILEAMRDRGSKYVAETAKNAVTFPDSRSSIATVIMGQFSPPHFLGVWSTALSMYYVSSYFYRMKNIPGVLDLNITLVGTPKDYGCGEFNELCMWVSTTGNLPAAMLMLAGGIFMCSSTWRTSPAALMSFTTSHQNLVKQRPALGPILDLLYANVANQFRSQLPPFNKRRFLCWWMRSYSQPTHPRKNAKHAKSRLKAWFTAGKARLTSTLTSNSASAVVGETKAAVSQTLGKDKAVVEANVRGNFGFEEHEVLDAAGGLRDPDVIKRIVLSFTQLRTGGTLVMIVLFIWPTLLINSAELRQAMTLGLFDLQYFIIGNLVAAAMAVVLVVTLVKEILSWYSVTTSMVRFVGSENIIGLMLYCPRGVGPLGQCSIGDWWSLRMFILQDLVSYRLNRTSLPITACAGLTLFTGVAVVLYVLVFNCPITSNAGLGLLGTVFIIMSFWVAGFLYKASAIYEAGQAHIAALRNVKITAMAVAEGTVPSLPGADVRVEVQEAGAGGSAGPQPDLRPTVELATSQDIDRARLFLKSVDIVMDNIRKHDPVPRVLGLPATPTTFKVFIGYVALAVGTLVANEMAQLKGSSGP